MTSTSESPNKFFITPMKDATPMVVDGEFLMFDDMWDAYEWLGNKDNRAKLSMFDSLTVRFIPNKTKDLRSFTKERIVINTGDETKVYHGAYPPKESDEND